MAQQELLSAIAALNAEALLGLVDNASDDALREMLGGSLPACLSNLETLMTEGEENMAGRLKCAQILLRRLSKALWTPASPATPVKYPQLGPLNASTPQLSALLSGSFSNLNSPSLTSPAIVNPNVAAIRDKRERSDSASSATSLSSPLASEFISLFLPDGAKRVIGYRAVPAVELLSAFAGKIRLQSWQYFGMHVVRAASGPESERLPNVGGVPLSPMAGFASDSVTQLLPAAGESRQWLNLQEPIYEQKSLAIGERDVVALAVQIGFEDASVFAEDPVGLGLVYDQHRSEFLHGWYPCEDSVGITLAALQIQVSFGNQNWPRDQDVKVFQEGIEKWLPAFLIKRFPSEEVKRLLLSRHARLTGLTPKEARSNFLNLIRTLPGFGVQFFNARAPRFRDTPFMVGLSRDGIGLYPCGNACDRNLAELFPYRRMGRWISRFSVPGWVEIRISTTDEEPLSETTENSFWSGLSELSFLLESTNGHDNTFLILIARLHATAALRRSHSLAARREILTVMLPDGTVRRTVATETTTPPKLLKLVAEKVDLRLDATFFDVCDYTSSSPRWFDPNEPVLDQQVSSGSTLMLRVRYWIQDPNQLKDPVAIRLYYDEVLEGVLDGMITVSEEEALDLATWQLQASLNLSSNAAPASVLGDCTEFVPENLLAGPGVGGRSIGWWQRRILARQQQDAVKSLPREFAQVKYLQLCFSLASFGFSYFSINDLRGRPALMGVSQKHVTVVHGSTQQVKFRYRIGSSLIGWKPTLGSLDLIVAGPNGGTDNLHIFCLDAHAVGRKLTFYARYWAESLEKNPSATPRNLSLSTVSGTTTVIGSGDILDASMSASLEASAPSVVARMQAAAANESAAAAYGSTGSDMMDDDDEEDSPAVPRMVVGSPTHSRRPSVATEEAIVNTNPVLIRVYTSDNSQCKVVAVRQNDTASDVCHAAAEKFLNTFGVAQSERLGLFEVHAETGRARWLSPTVKPAALQASWESGRFKFVLMDASKVVTVKVADTPLTGELAVVPTDSADDFVCRARMALAQQCASMGEVVGVLSDPGRTFSLCEVSVTPKPKADGAAASSPVEMDETRHVLAPDAYVLDYVTNWVLNNGTKHCLSLVSDTEARAASGRAITTQFVVDSVLGAMTVAEIVLVVRPEHSMADVTDMAMRAFFLSHDQAYDLQVVCPPVVPSPVLVRPGYLLEVLDRMGLAPSRGATPPTLTLSLSSPNRQQAAPEPSWSNASWSAALQDGPQQGIRSGEHRRGTSRGHISERERMQASRAEAAEKNRLWMEVYGDFSGGREGATKLKWQDTVRVYDSAGAKTEAPMRGESSSVTKRTL